MRDLLLRKMVHRVRRLDSLLHMHKLVRMELLGVPDSVDISRVCHPPNEQLHVSHCVLKSLLGGILSFVVIFLRSS